MSNKNKSTNLPLSGDVSQVINPWNWWGQAFGQFGLININTSASSNPKLEQDIVQNVASYGRQLGRIMEVLNVVIQKKGDLSSLNAHQQAEISAFQELAGRIEALKQSRHPVLTVEEAEAFIKSLQELRLAEPARYNQITQRLKEIISL